MNPVVDDTRLFYQFHFYIHPMNDERSSIRRGKTVLSRPHERKGSKISWVSSEFDKTKTGEGPKRPELHTPPVLGITPADIEPSVGPETSVAFQGQS